MRGPEGPKDNSKVAGSIMPSRMFPISRSISPRYTLTEPLPFLDPIALTHVRYTKASLVMVVTYGQALATETAKGQPLEQRRAFARRMAPLAATTVRHGVLQQVSTIALILFPGDVTGVGLGQDRVPLILRHAANETLAIRHSAHARLTMHVTAGVARILEQLQGQAVGQGGPKQLPLVHATAHPARELELLLAKIPHDAHCGADPLELPEERGEHLLNLLIRIKDDAVLRVVIEADGQRFPQLAAPRLALDAAQQTGAENMELCL